MRKNKGHKVKLSDGRDTAFARPKGYEDYVRESKIREGWADDKAARFARRAEKGRVLGNWESNQLRGLELWARTYKPSQRA